MKKLLENFKSDSPEYEYFGALLKVLSYKDFIKSEKSALALLFIINTAHFRIGDVDSFNHPISGSQKDNAWFISQIFSNLGLTEYDWFEKNLIDREQDFGEEYSYWVKYFEECPNIEVHNW